MYRKTYTELIGEREIGRERERQTDRQADERETDR